MSQSTTNHGPGELKRFDSAVARECGDVQVVGSRIGVVAGLKAVDVGDDYTLSTWGVKTMTAKTSDVWADGDVLYWDAGNDWLTDVAGDHVKAGLADGAKLAGASRAACDVNARA